MPFPSKEHQFKPGNPGRPRQPIQLSNMLAKVLEGKAKARGNKTVGEMLVEMLVEIAMKDGGDRRAIKDIFERIEGRPKQAIEISAGAESATCDPDAAAAALAAASRVLLERSNRESLLKNGDGSRFIVGPEHDPEE